MKSGTGYRYTYDESGKVVSLARKTMEEKLGRKLREYESVTYKDGNKDNCSAENLVLSLKHGTPITQLKCQKCGTVGSVELNA